MVQERVQGLADMIGKEWVISEDLSSENETDALNWDDSDIMCPVERRLSVRRKSLLAVDKVLLIVPFLNHFIVFVVTLSGCCFVSNVSNHVKFLLSCSYKHRVSISCCS